MSCGTANKLFLGWPDNPTSKLTLPGIYDYYVTSAEWKRVELQNKILHIYFSILHA